MKLQTRIEAASKQLDRVLGFFPRAEAKASFLFAIDTAILALVALNLRLADFGIWYLALPAVAAIALAAASLYFLYLGAFPQLKGGSDSLIYFREIARRTEASFISEFENIEEEAYARDLLGQVWRNSEILKRKFDSLHLAFILTAIAILPWFAFLVLSTFAHAQLPAVK